MKMRIVEKKNSIIKSFVDFNNNYFKFLRNAKIHMRLIIAFMLISIIPSMIIGVISYTTSTKSMKNKISVFSEQIMEQLEKNMRVELDKYSYLCDQISVSEVIQNNLKNAKKFDDNKKNSNTVEINNILGQKALYYNYINDLQINTTGGDVFYDRGYGQIYLKDIDRITKNIVKQNGRDYWTYARSINGTKCIALGRRMNSLDNFDIPLGYAYVSIDESVFSKNTYKSVNMGKGTDVFIIDENGIVVSSVNPEITIGESYKDKELAAKLKLNLSKGIKSYNEKIGSKNCLVVYKYLENNNWFIVSTIPFSYINSETESIRISIILVCALCIFFSLLLSLIISISILVPLRKIDGFTKEVIDGNLDIRIDDEGGDEMGYLSIRLNTMIDKIKELIEQVKREQRGKREKELEVLQAQINPHFLFNTLNSLKWTAMMSRVNVVSDGIGALAELLRNTIINNKDMISVREELKNIQNYVIIQKIRYGDSFDVIYENDEEALDLMILKFLLQPIVENSIIHGMDGINHKVIIELRTLIEENYLKIIIKDNGKGFDLEEYKKINNKASGSKNRLSNIGISNVEERIQLNFGPPHSINMVSRTGEGTTVTIVLPIIKNVEGEKNV